MITPTHKRLAEGLADTPGFVVDVDRVQTNIVFFELDSSVKVSGEVVAQRMLEQRREVDQPRRVFPAFPRGDTRVGYSRRNRSCVAGIQVSGEELKKWLTNGRGSGIISPRALVLDPWCSGLTCGPVKAEIAGSNPVGSVVTTEAFPHRGKHAGVG